MTTRREFLATTFGTGILAVASAGPGGNPSRESGIDGTDRRPDGDVQTVLGPVKAAELGFTLAHEHICSIPRTRQADRLGAVRYMADKLLAAKDAGIDAIVDTTTFDVGRDVRFGQEVSLRSGMHLVVSTGQHVFAPEELSARSIEQIAELFIREIDQGIEGTDIMAGAIKVAARSDAMTPAEFNVFRAAARAHRATGVPIQTHTNARRRAGARQAEIFEAENVDPSRVSLGHSDDTDDFDYLRGLAQRGFTLGMDHAFYGMVAEATVPFRRRIEYIRELIDAGFGERILLSTDWELGERERLNPDGLRFVTDRTVPQLHQLGMSQRQMRRITTENPARFFARDAVRPNRLPSPQRD